MAKRKSKTKKATSKRSSLVPPKKMLRSQPPDVIVAVGQGKNKTQFECYKLFLCFNCEYFDTMFSLPMRENETSQIDLPDKDPEEWKVFYEFIDPATSFSAEVTDKNAMTLVPWFHEYQMNKLLTKCDHMIHDNIINDDNKVEIGNLKILLDHSEFCEKYSLKKSLEKAIIELSTLVMHALGLLKDNLETLNRVFNIYKGHKKVMDELLCCQTKNLLAEIEENESEAEDMWENKCFRRLIETKLENMVSKKLYEYSDSDYREIRGSVIVKGAGLNVVNGIYVRHSEKYDSVSRFTKRGLFRDTSCVFELNRFKTSWYISIFSGSFGTPLGHYYFCNSSGTENELPLGYKWVTMNGRGIDPPPTVEYINQLSSVSNETL